MVSGPFSNPAGSPGREDNPLQRLLSESTADDLSRCLGEPMRLVKTDLGDLVSQGVTTLVTMAAELGVVLRIQIRGDKMVIAVDVEKIRRAINALVIHLLTVSRSEGRVTVELEDKPVNGKRGISLRLSAGSVILPWKSNPEFESELNTQPELSACRRIIEKHRGTLTVEWRDDNKLSYQVWLPVKFPTGGL